MDELHGILIAYEMRTEQDNPPRKEATFKASKKTKKNKQKPKSKPSCTVVAVMIQMKMKRWPTS
jgi:hypothetical protein